MSVFEMSVGQMSEGQLPVVSQMSVAKCFSTKSCGTLFRAICSTECRHSARRHSQTGRVTYDQHYKLFTTVTYELAHLATVVTYGCD